MVSRPLSPMERWYWICDQLSPLNVIARVHLTGTCTTADLERAAAMLATEHPLLRVAIAAEPDGGHPRFVDAGDTRIPVRTVRAGQWQQEIDRVELTSSVDRRSGPLARIVHIVHAGDEHDLILTVSHVIADGTSALELLRRLVELAAGTASPKPRPPLPPPEALLPRRINRLPRVVHAIAWTIADQFAMVLARPRRLAPDTPVAPDRRRTRLIHRELDGAQLDTLTDRCRHEGVTVHSALAAAMAIAVASVSPPAKSVTIGSPVDFRAELVPPVHRHDAGAYVATVPSHVRVVPTDLWTTARRAHRDLRRRTRFHQHLALVSLLRLMSPRTVGASARAVRMVERVGPGNVCLSNIGRYDFPERAGPWQLSGAQFVAGISVSGYLVATVNTSHAALHWNVTYIDGVVTGERAALIADRAVRILLSALTQPERRPAWEREVEHGERSGRGPRHRRVIGAG